MTIVFAWGFFQFSLFVAGLVYNVYRPTYAPAKLALLSFFLGWLTGELGLHATAGWMIASGVFLMAGAGAHVVGQLAFVITLASSVLLLFCYFRAWDVGLVMATALRSGLGPDFQQRIRPRGGARDQPDG